MANQLHITVPDAARRLRVDPRTVRRMLAEGQLVGYRLVGYRLGARDYVTRASLEPYVDLVLEAQRLARSGDPRVEAAVELTRTLTRRSR